MILNHWNGRCRDGGGDTVRLAHGYIDLSRLSTMRTRTGGFSAYALMVSYRQRDADTRRKILDTCVVLPLRQAARAAGLTDEVGISTVCCADKKAGGYMLPVFFVPKIKCAFLKNNC